ncbi:MULTISPECIES: hypothetical protein [Corynebacterium]|uniref:hypothetical protein n=1 Tax=Corynebacterium TaxID=1716 RepID=UPI00195714C1|nr:MULTISPECIES: hypothetical protein [Corynebacterium]QRQ65533.1 hypothetical protein I6J23_03580 [Corynebacterium kroppenstedtii]
MQLKTIYFVYFLLLFFGIGAIAAELDGSPLAKPTMTIALIASLIFSFVTINHKRKKMDR